MQALRMSNDESAWNMDGSASDRPTVGRSWIQEWERKTHRHPGCCSFVGCNNPAEYGGHVWIRNFAGVFIAPICRECNYCENPTRMQGSGSRIRRGTFVIPRPYTQDMSSAPRRIVSSESRRRCQECGIGIMEQPPNHRLCLACFSRQTHPATSRRVQEVHRRSRRPCQTCRSDISDSPPHHTQCLDCFLRGEQSRGPPRSCRGKQRAYRRRRCRCCGTDISDRPLSHTLCYGCFMDDDDSDEWSYY